jgi:signal transduction histidine kinase
MVDDTLIAAFARAYLMETAPVLALQLDHLGCVVDASAQALRILGDGIIGCRFAERVVDFSGSLDLAALIARGEGLHPLTISTVAGIPETLQFRFFPLPGGALALGSLNLQEEQKLRNGVLELNRELNNLTRQLQLTNAELRELNALKNRFIGMAAHDLRQPIGVIMAYGNFVLAEAGAHLDDEQQGFLRTILAAAISMKRLIDNFLNVSIIESGNLRLEPTQTEVAGILSGVLPMVRLLAARKKVELLLETTNDPRVVMLDIAKIQQVLLNLLINGIEHSQSGRRIWLVSRWDDSKLVFSVRDEGPGISSEDQKRLFAPFVRAGTRKTAGERGTGLGLAIARQVVNAHGGRLWVESEPGQGATFFVELPVSAEAVNTDS